MALTLKKGLVMGLIVEESQKTKKARKKLRDRMDNLEKKVTPQALKRKSEEISRWIERHAAGRVVVKKDIPLFDKNANPAKPSRGIEKIAEELAIADGLKKVSPPHKGIEKG